MSLRVTIVAVAFTSMLPSAVRAQTETKTAVADALYRQARDLMAAGDYARACPKFAESQRLDPATGTLLNLAACHEKQGRLATAWLEYSDAVFAARRDAREDRVAYAEERARALEPKLSRLTLQLAADADEPNLEIELDGASVGRAVIGAPTPVDPGGHAVRVSAPGKKAWSQTIQIEGEAAHQSLTIPKLEPAPAAPSAPPAVPTAATPTQTGSSGPLPGDELASRPIPTSVYISGGVTLALAVGAGVTGLSYLNRKQDYDDAVTTRSDIETTEQRRQSAQRIGFVNLGLWVGTALGAGVTTYLYVMRPERARTTRLLPWAGPESAGLSVVGGF